MKWWLFFLFISILSIAFSQKEPKTLKVYFNDKQFYIPEEGSYIEVQLNFLGHTLSFTEKNNDTIAELSILHLFRKGEDVEVYDKVILESPPVKKGIVENFFDIQRFAIGPGTYTYELTVQDLNSKAPPLTIEKIIHIKEMNGQVAFSEITLAETILPTNTEQTTIFSKSGYDIVPMTSAYYPKQMTMLPYYLELYNTDRFYKDSVYVIEQGLASLDTLINLEEYTRYYRYKSSPIQPIAKAIDITHLPTGKYELYLNLINRDKEILHFQTLKFKRKNTPSIHLENGEFVDLDPLFKKSLPLDSSHYYVASLIPICSPSEVKNIIRLLKEKNESNNRKYLQAFWEQTHPEDPYNSWIAYKKQVELVESLYATNFQMGHETDRGRVYLQYGEPNQISSIPLSPSEYPYEIWQYDKIERFSNRRFIFYSPTNLNNDYRLLHSDMLGEIQNYRWKFALNKRNTPDTNLDDPYGAGEDNHWGRNSSLYYNSY